MVLTRSAFALIVCAFVLDARSTTFSQPVALTGNGQIVGVISDSLSSGFLAGADILVEPGSYTAATDSLGKFKVDRLAPGAYRLGVFHPRLDTLGITLLTQPIRVGSDSASLVQLAVPSAMTLIRRSCRVQSGPYGESAVIGRVVDAETLAPIARAEVSIAWVEIDISKEAGVRREPFVVRDTTNEWGSFTFCGLPNSLKATLQAKHGSASTPEIPVSLGDQPVELMARTVLLPASGAPAKSGKASVSGVVTLEGARSNAGSRIELVGTGVVAVTNERGEFTMRNVPSGTRVLVVRHIGFLVQVVPVDLSSREEQKIKVSLPRYVEMMDPILVSARSKASLERVGFTRRRKDGVGFFIGPEQLETRRYAFLSDLLKQVPSLRVSYGAHGDVVTPARGVTSGCIQYYLDASPYVEMTLGDVNRFVAAREIVGIEVYDPISTPAEYVRGGADCTTILIWTRLRLRG